jgi:hypothetical protein
MRNLLFMNETLIWEELGMRTGECDEKYVCNLIVANVSVIDILDVSVISQRIIMPTALLPTQHGQIITPHQSRSIPT